MTRVGLRIPHDLTFEAWERAGAHLSNIVDSSAWCLGDWLVHGKRNYVDRYKQAIKMAGLDYQTLRNYAWVARRFEISRRRDQLSFQHHAEVASLPVEEQNGWLDQAEAATWSTKQLRVRVRAYRKGSRRDGESISFVPRIAVTAVRLSRWRDAADQSGVDFELWVVAALDSAAEQASR